MVNTALNARSVDTIGEEKPPTRDQRYKDIITRQLGPNGINLLIAYSFIVIVLLLLIILSTVGYASTFKPLNAIDNGPAQPILVVE